jgi:import inner membrane translocase subunit TIM50
MGIAGEVLKSQNETEGKLKSSPPGQQQQNNSEEDEEAKKKKEAEASWRTMKYTLIFFGVTLSGLSGYIVGTWGAPGQCDRRPIQLKTSGTTIYPQVMECHNEL